METDRKLPGGIYEPRVKWPYKGSTHFQKMIYEAQDGMDQHTLFDSDGDRGQVGTLAAVGRRQARAVLDPVAGSVVDPGAALLEPGDSAARATPGGYRERFGTLRATETLRDDVVDDISVDVGEPVVASSMPERQAFVIESEEMEQGGVKVV